MDEAEIILFYETMLAKIELTPLMEKIIKNREVYSQLFCNMYLEPLVDEIQTELFNETDMNVAKDTIQTKYVKPIGD